MTVFCVKGLLRSSLTRVNQALPQRVFPPLSVCQGDTVKPQGLGAAQGAPGVSLG